MKIFKVYLSLVLAVMMGFTACKSSQTGTASDDDRGMSKTTKGGAIGAGAGAVIGGVIGRATGNTAAGAIIGAAAGGTAGAVIGRRMDKQAEELERELKSAKVERVGEGIKVAFDAGILFDVNSAELRPAAKRDIEKLAETLKKYPGTNVLIEGHTDNTGGRELNQRLSERRAESVANYAQSLGVEPGRLTAKGYGFDQPVADNSTEAGRQENRRVEVAIFASEEMKRDAEAGNLK
jgi:outer membrane protein OmpA-like peptidoglycan-associated protein